MTISTGKLYKKTKIIDTLPKRSLHMPRFGSLILLELNTIILFDTRAANNNKRKKILTKHEPKAFHNCNFTLIAC